MQIGGSIPFQVAQAYGLPRRSVAPTNAAQTTMPTRQTAPANHVRIVDATSDLSAIPGVKRPSGIDKLVGGTVHRPISFDGAATATPQDTFSLPLYTRAADKVEAAVAVNVGRAIDVRG